MVSVIRGNDNFDSGTVGSTTSGDVGTYANVGQYSSAAHNLGDTVSGSSLFTWEGYSSSNVSSGTSFTFGGVTKAQSFSGTWRWMSSSVITGTRSRFGLAVRIS